MTFIHIGDLHGHLVPRVNMRDGDPTHGQMVGGLAYVYDQIKKIRKRHPDSLLINTGDTIQGSAEVLYSRGQHIVDILNNGRQFVPEFRRHAVTLFRPTQHDMRNIVRKRHLKSKILLS